MKIKKFIFGATALVATVALASCTGGSDATTPAGTSTPEGTSNPATTTPAGTTDTTDYKYEAKIWVSESDGVKELTERQVAEFNRMYPNVAVKATVEGISESTAATSMTTDVETGADIFCFAQDQLNRLVTAGALSELSKNGSDFVIANNDDSSVNASKVNGKIYCYPITSDNGYFMMYNKDVISAENLDNLEAIVAECEAKGYNFSMENETSGWYSASWFFATGCKQDWTTDASGKFVSVDDTFNSPAGLVAMQGMQHLVKSDNYVSSSNAADFGAAKPSAVVVTGTWGLATAKQILGDKFGATDLPSFTVDGQSYHLGSFNGFKLMGVKPQTDATKAVVLNQLAQYLSGKDAQMARFEEFGWGPSNKEAQADPAVAGDEALAALNAQMVYGKPQGQIHGSWWDLSKVYAQGACDADKGDLVALQAALTSYKEAIDDLFKMSDAELRAWTVIGAINDTGWNTDFEMTETAEGSNIWVSVDAFTMAAGTEFKCRQGKSWTKSFGSNGENYKVEAAGTYKVKFTYDATADSGIIELIAA